MKKNKRKKTLNKANNILSLLVYFAGTYISLNVFPSELLYNILGVSFLISGVYGIIAIYKNSRYIFGETKSLKMR